MLRVMFILVHFTLYHYITISLYIYIPICLYYNIFKGTIMSDIPDLPQSSPAATNAGENDPRSAPGNFFSF
jgi:hypothetical protein